MIDTVHISRVLSKAIQSVARIIGTVEKLLDAGKMAQQSRGLAALPEDPGPVASTHVAVHN